MKLITKAQLRQLEKNWVASKANPEGAEPHKPVVKLFNPCGAQTWLISEIDPESDTAFGLADLGFGCPEMGYVSLNEIQMVRGPYGLGVERDKCFRADKTLVEYADEARSIGSIKG